MRILTGTVPLKPRRSGPDVRLTVLISFAAGILLGVPLTFGALFLGTLNHRDGSTPPVARDEGLHEAISSSAAPRHPAVTGGEQMSVVRHPTATQLTIVGKFGPKTHEGPYARRRGGIGSVIPRHASDFRTWWHDDSGRGQRNGFPSRLMSEEENVVAAALQPILDFRAFTDGVFWTDLAESLVPKGFGEEDARQWRKFLNASQVVRVEDGCGRMQNRLVTMSDGKLSCCRYRHNNDQIQGEIFSFYLGRLLKIDNLSPSALALVDPRTRRWSAAASQMALALWSSERPAVLTQFVHKLQPAFVPKQFRDSKKRRLHPIREDLHNLTAPEVSELVQWSDLVIFDYLTANLDRVVNNMYNEQWSPGMMSQPTHNLAKTPEGLLLFLDNESGLLHGYRLLEKYEHYHRSLLDVLCLFRKKTIRAIEALHRDNNIDSLLKQAFAESDPGMSDWLPFLPDRSIRTLKERLAQILSQVQRCRSKFGPAQLIDR